MEMLAQTLKPNLIIAGASCYARTIDFARFRAAADREGALLLVDMAHIAGLVAGGVFQSPFDFADLVTSTTHKTLRGPRSGLIFYRKDRISNAAQRLQFGVFPGVQGGPHLNQIAAVAACLKQAASPEFREYQTQVLRNSKRMASCLAEMDYEVLTGGTDNHLVLISLANKSLITPSSKGELAIDGARVEFLGDQVRHSVFVLTENLFHF